jgi:hypothetical protein
MWPMVAEAIVLVFKWESVITNHMKPLKNDYNTLPLQSHVFKGRYISDTGLLSPIEWYSFCEAMYSCCGSQGARSSRYSLVAV